MRPATTIAAVLAAVLAACGGGSASPATTASPTGSPAPDPVAPLTGLPAGAGLADRPAVAVKIGNSQPARPQSGLAAADIVYEELVEGGLTRFVALFHGKFPERIGPVRSARLVDAAILPAHDPVLVLSGARDEVLDALEEAGIGLLGDDGSGVLTRDPSRSSPHNLYVSGPALLEAAADLARPARPAFTYDEDIPAGFERCRAPAGEPCQDPGRGITVQMSPASVTGWRYEEASGRYRRTQDGATSEVAGGGSVGAANVVVLGLEVRAGACCDSAGNRLVATRVVGSGPAVVLRDGRRYRGRWDKPQPARHLTLAVGGRPLALRPGPTWVLLAPRSALPAGG